MAAADFRLINPNTGTAPIFRNARDAEITTRIYRNHPVLVDRSGGGERKAWPVKYTTMFHMTNDSKLFVKREELIRDGWQSAELNRWRKGTAEAVPLYEGKMVQMYDHRAADVVVNAANLNRAAQPDEISASAHAEPNRLAMPQFWVPAADVVAVNARDWALGFKEITAPTNMRTMIGALMPGVGFGNKLPILLIDSKGGSDAPTIAAMLLANFNSLAFDFVLRQKLQGQTINLFILEQLPVVEAAAYNAALGKGSVADFVRAEVLHLSYTALDVAPFARDLGYVDAQGEIFPPFVWDDEDRRHRIARLDALFMRLYGLDKDDAAYILDSFPIVRAKDDAAFGRYRTRDLVLGYMERIAGGDVTAVING